LDKVFINLKFFQMSFQASYSGAAEPKCEFETKFATVYQRNNKARSKGKEGMKNIRCFPDHGVGGHVEKGFCGSTVSFLAYFNETDGNFRAWAQFEIANASTNPQDRCCQVGDVFTTRTIAESFERTRYALSKPWFPSTKTRLDSETVRFIINSERWGWNYSWVSNVHTCDLSHRLSIFLFKQLDQTQLICVKVLESSEFQVFCSRRRRTPSTSPRSSISLLSPISTSSSTVEEELPEDTSATLANTSIDNEPKRIKTWMVATDWKEAEMNAANLLLLVRTGSSHRVN